MICALIVASTQEGTNEHIRYFCKGKKAIFIEERNPLTKKSGKEKKEEKKKRCI